MTGLVLNPSEPEWLQFRRFPSTRCCFTPALGPAVMETPRLPLPPGAWWGRGGGDADREEWKGPLKSALYSVPFPTL